MSDADSTPFSRRHWLASAVAASVGAGLLSAKTSAAQTATQATAGSPGARTFDVREYGAIGDGKTLDTAAV
ncbi:MAG TPA: hypothetical protein VFV81_03855, partial [Verrucomicrobiae bacterium]|nr:hypothetical protein [Verrucomicrobiae bacterium]